MVTFMKSDHRIPRCGTGSISLRTKMRAGQARDLETESLESAKNSGVAPSWVLGGHLHNQLLDLRVGPRTTGLASLRGVFRGDPLAIPSEQGLRRDDGIELAENFPTENFGDLPKVLPIASIRGNPRARGETGGYRTSPTHAGAIWFSSAFELNVSSSR